MSFKKKFVNLILISAIIFALGYVIAQNSAKDAGKTEKNRLVQKSDAEKKKIKKSIKFYSEKNKEIGKMIRATLDNGLEVIIQEMKNTDVVSVRAYVKFFVKSFHLLMSYSFY